MQHFEKLSNEHRAAWNEIVAIENSKEEIGDKIKRIIRLFDSELLPHFKDEEDNVFSNDAISMDLINEHEKIYLLIDVMKRGVAEKQDVAGFISILKGHIKKEDAYFSDLNKTKKSNDSLVAVVVVVLVLILFVGFFRTSP